MLSTYLIHVMFFFLLIAFELKRLKKAQKCIGRKVWVACHSSHTFQSNCLSHLIDFHDHYLPFAIPGFTEMCLNAGPPNMCELRNAFAKTLPSVVMHSLARLPVWPHSATHTRTSSRWKSLLVFYFILV